VDRRPDRTRGRKFTFLGWCRRLGANPSPPELIGRVKECRALEGLLEAVRGGQSQVLVVRGDAGVGKSALLQYLVSTAAGFRVAHATGVESRSASDATP
jgi:hypothetical protein